MTQTEQQPLKTCEFLRPAEAAKYLRVSRTTIWRWARERPDFPKPIRLSATIAAFRRADIDAFAARIEA